MGLLELLILVIVLAWLFGYRTNFGGDLIHILVAVAVLLVIFRLARGV